MQDFLNVQDFVVRQLFLPTLSVSLLGTLTGMFIAAIHPATRKYFSAKWNYYIWLLVVARLAVPFHLGSGVNLLLPAPFHSAQQGSVQNGDIHFGVENADARIPDPLLSESGGVQPTAVSADASADADGTLTSVRSSQTDAAANAKILTLPALRPKKNRSGIGMLTLLADIWLLGVVLALCIKLANYLRFINTFKKNCTRIADSRVLTMEHAFCAGLGITRVPAICQSAAVSGPLTVGLWNPVIVLPDALWNPDSDGAGQHLTHLQLVLHHELIHVARKDLLYKWIFHLLLCVHWFNPALHRIGRQINLDCELSCDTAILAKLTDAGKQLYGNILLDTAERAVARGQSALSTTLLEHKHDLKKRLDGILHNRRPTRLQLALSACTLTVTLLVTACGGIWISAEDTAVHERTSDSSESDDDHSFAKMLTSLGSVDSFLESGTSPDRLSNAWQVYDDAALLAGSDIQENWRAYIYSGGNKKLTVSGLELYGSKTFLIVYADEAVDVDVKSSFAIKEGKFKIVHIAPDNTVTTLNDTGSKSTQTCTIQKGRNVLKIVGQGARLTSLEIDYTDLKESKFEQVYFSEEAETNAQIKNTLLEGKVIDKEKVLQILYALDAKEVSETLHTMLSHNIELTAEEIAYFFLYSDSELSSQYLSEALRDGTLEPFCAEDIIKLMPYLQGECPTEMLKALPQEEFVDALSESVYYLDSDQIADCLTDYLAQGGALTYPEYGHIAPYLDEDAIKVVNELLTGSGE